MPLVPPRTGWLFRDVVDIRSPAAMCNVPLVLHRLMHPAEGLPSKHVDFYARYIVERGRGSHVIDSRTYATSRGDVYVMGVGSEHMFQNCHNLSLHAILFSDDVFDESTWRDLTAVPGFDKLLVNHPASRRLHLDPAAHSAVEVDLAELWREWTGGSSSDALRVRNVFLHLLLRLARFAAGARPGVWESQPLAQSREDVVAAAVRTIDLHYGEPLRIAQLAAAAHLSPERFREVFAEVMGQAPRAYIQHVRFERARTLLATTALPISHIARTIGMADHANFTRRFRAATGLSPREHRHQAQSQLS
jgi:AraC-like DNA-binding protein